MDGHHKATRIYSSFGELLQGLTIDHQRIEAGSFYRRFRWILSNRTTRTDPFVQSFASEYDAGLCARDWRAAWPTNRYTVEREAA